MADYETLIEKAVEKEESVLSTSMAVKIANRTEGLEIDDNGEIQKMNRPGKQVLEDLVEEYKEVSGDVAYSIIGRKLSNVDTEGLDIPDNISDFV